jgi:hypothetical protein
MATQKLRNQKSQFYRYIYRHRYILKSAEVLKSPDLMDGKNVFSRDKTAFVFSHLAQDSKSASSPASDSTLLVMPSFPYTIRAATQLRGVRILQ